MKTTEAILILIACILSAICGYQLGFDQGFFRGFEAYDRMTIEAYDEPEIPYNLAPPFPGDDDNPFIEEGDLV